MMIPDNYEKFKESKNFIVYLPKDRKGKKQIKMLVQFKINNKFIEVILTDKSFKLFFEPDEYKKVYMKENQGKGSR